MAWPDNYKNFAYSTVATAPSPAASGTSLVVATGDGILFPTPPFNATVWPTGTQPTPDNAEIVRVTNISTDTFTITRTQESTSARTILVGDQIAATITAKTFEDVENSYLGSWAPFYMGSAMSGLQTLARSSSATSTGSMIVFPVTIPSLLKFNQILIANSLSFITTTGNNPASNTYVSKFGLYRITDDILTLISSNSFSIAESVSSVSLTWNYPTSTATSGYGYGSFPAGNLTTTVQVQSYLSYSRVIGLQFGGEVALSADVYWVGLLSLKSTANYSSIGLSHAGVIGLIANAVNSGGTVSGANPIGVIPAMWSVNNSNLTGWRGRHVMGVLTNTAFQNYSGTAIPPSITISAIGGAANSQTMSILPSVTFVST